MFKIWGLNIEEIISDEYILWKIEIRNPFKENNKWKVGLNEKLFRLAWKRGVEKLILNIGQKEIMLNIPNNKDLKRKVKVGEYEDKKSMFINSTPMRIYYFSV